jgi:hypothetical protein
MTYSVGPYPDSVAVGDFNNDTQLDFVSSVENSVDIFLGYASVLLAHEVKLLNENDSRPRSFAIGDFDNDNQMDITVVNSGTNDIGIFLGFSNNSFAHETTYPTDVYLWSAAVGHFNNDMNLEIAVLNSNDNNLSVLLGCGDDFFANQVTYSTGSNSQPYSITIADFNNGTFVDIILANHNSNNVYALILSIYFRIK